LTMASTHRYGYEALFKSFRLGSAKNPRVYSTDELEGFAELESEDQDTLSALIDAENEFRAGLAKVDDDAIRLEHAKNDGVFWSVVQSGATTRVRWGAIGDEGNVSEKEHKDEAAATKFVEKKIAEKEKGGYVRTADAGSKRKAADDKEEDGEVEAPVKAKEAPAAKKAKKEVATKKGKQKEVVAEPAKEEAPAPTAAAASGGGGGDAETVYGWAVEYAKSGRSKCQSTKELIEQGAGTITPS
jgi:predicted DNA-binding WGR domain protein